MAMAGNRYSDPLPLSTSLDDLQRRFQEVEIYLMAVYKGNGNPNNVVAAPVGSLFLRSDGGTTSTLYVKESGTSAAGWVSK